jgi:hypothetical protein
VKIDNRPAKVLRPQLSRVTFMRVSVSTRRCIKQNRQTLSVPLRWAHKRRGENVRDRKAGLGRVLFTSSPFPKLRLVENEPFDSFACRPGGLLFARTGFISRAPQLGCTPVMRGPASRSQRIGRKHSTGPLPPPDVGTSTFGTVQRSSSSCKSDSSS